MENPLDRFDIRLNDIGYQLARDQDGNLLAAGARTQLIDHFTRHVQETERWARVTFQFSGGAGAAVYDGSHRYRWGDNVDTRGGRAIRGPKVNWPTSDLDAGYQGATVLPNEGSTITDQEIGSGAAFQGFAYRFQPSQNWSIDRVSVLIKADPDVDYAGLGAAINVRLYADAAGPRPGAALNTVTVAWIGTVDREAIWYNCDPWQAGEYYWAFEIFPATALTSGTWYWVGIENATAESVWWARVSDTTGTGSYYNGAVWTAGATEAAPCFKINREQEIGAPPVWIGEYRTPADALHMFVLADHRSYWRDNYPAGIPGVNSKWALDNNLAVNVRCGAVFNNLVFAGLGTATDMRAGNLNPPNTFNPTVANERAICFGVHDGILWKAGGTNASPGGQYVNGSLQGVGGTWGAVFTVGDPGTDVTALASHGGKLYAAKEEGIYEITYPNTYPGSGTPTSNLVLDFSADRCVRRWMYSWHSGLYFPITGGVGEWKNDTITDIWQDRVDPGVQRVEPQPQGPSDFVGVEQFRRFDGPRRYTPMETTDEAGRGFFTAAEPTVRGIYFALNSPHLTVNSIWWWDGTTRSWHPITGKRYHSIDALSEGTDWYLAEYILALYYQSFGTGKGRLWFGLGNEVGYIHDPSYTRDRMLYSDVDYTRATMIELPVFDGGDPRTVKDFWAIDIISKNAGNDARWDVQYQIDSQQGDDTNWVSLGGGAGRIVDSPHYRVQLPQNTVGRNIRIRVVDTGVDGAMADSLELEAVDLLYHVLPDTVITHELLIKAATFGEHHQGQDTRTARQIRDELMALMEEEEPFTYQSLLGDEVEVKMMSCQVEIPSMLATSGEEPAQDILFHPAPTEVWVRVLLLELEETVEAGPA